MHVGLFDLDEVQAHHRIELDHPRLRALPHHLLVHLRFGRHIDQHIAEKLCLAGQPAPRLQPALLVIAALHRREA